MIVFVSIPRSPKKTQSASHRTKNFEVVRISTCPVCPFVNVGAVDAQVTSCDPMIVPVAFVLFPPNLERYAQEVALVPDKRIPYPSCPRSCRLF